MSNGIKVPYHPASISVVERMIKLLTNSVHICCGDPMHALDFDSKNGYHAMIHHPKNAVRCHECLLCWANYLKGILCHLPQK